MPAQVIFVISELPLRAESKPYLTTKINFEKLMNFTKLFLIFVGKQSFSLVFVAFFYQPV